MCVYIYILEYPIMKEQSISVSSAAGVKLLLIYTFINSVHSWNLADIY